MSESNQKPAPLQATERDNTLNPRQLRTAGFLPATLYANNIESQSIQVREIEFVRLYQHGVREFQLTGLAGEIVARAHQVQIKPIKEEVLNIEFLQLSPVGTPKAKKASKPAAKSGGKKAAKEGETVLTGA